MSEQALDLPTGAAAGTGKRSCLVRYIVVTPVRNEEQYLEETLRSVISQTVRPTQWAIVNDGSTDRTGEILDRYARQYPWIHSVHRKDRGFRKSGGGVVEAFNDGYARLDPKDCDFVVKLDGDLSFSADYFERCFEHFSQQPRLGIAGGLICHTVGGALKPEKTPLFHVRGATKIYRKECWDALGGLLAAPGWDTLDEVKANMLGWRTRTIPELRVLHYRPTGAADGTWASAVKNGRSDYISGYHPLFVVAKCAKRLFQKPFVIDSLGHSYGFLTGYAKKIPRIDDRDLIAYLRRQQIKRLIGQGSIWA